MTTYIDDEIFRVAVLAGMKASDVTSRDVAMIDHLLMRHPHMAFAKVAELFKAWKAAWR